MADKATIGVARVAGRIAASRRINGANGATFRTVLKQPAPDQYSSPSTIEVRSTERIGAVGDEVSIAVRIGGYSRSYRPKDDPTGAPIATAENVLEFAGHA